MYFKDQYKTFDPFTISCYIIKKIKNKKKLNSKCNALCNALMKSIVTNLINYYSPSS